MNRESRRILALWREDLALLAFVLGVTVKSVVVILLIAWVLTEVQKGF